MLSTFIRPCLTSSAKLARSTAWATPVPRRCMSHYVPPDQYDNNAIPKSLQLTHAMVVHWEIIPVVGVTAIAFSFCAFAIIWALVNKVDVVYSTHNYNTLSRTMNLYRPDNHKFITINQRYEPWPEMQKVLDKMRDAEKKALNKLQNCPPD